MSRFVQLGFCRHVVRRSSASVSAFLVFAIAPGPAAHAAPPNAAVGKAAAFASAMLSRATSAAKAWPSTTFTAPVVRARYDPKSPCVLLIDVSGGVTYRLDFAAVVSVRLIQSSSPSQAHVEIAGGSPPFRSIDLFVGGDGAIDRVDHALAAMQQGCDALAGNGF